MPFHQDTSADVERLRASLADLPEPVSQPFLIIVGGLPGTGKSYLSRLLAQRIPAAVIQSDVLRKALVSRPMYTWDENRRLFDASHRLIEDLLGGGTSVIFDATNLQEAHREELYRVAERAGARAITVWVEAPPEVVWERMADRRRRVDPHDRSEADWEVYRKMVGTEQRPRHNFFKVNTAGDIRPVIEKIVRACSPTQRGAS